MQHDIPATATEFRIETTHLGPVTIVAPIGALDLCTAPQLQACVLISNGAAAMVIDLSGVTFLGLAGVEVLLAAVESTQDQLPVRLVANGRATLRPISLSGLTDRLCCFRDLNSALADLQVTTRRRFD